MKSSLDLAQVNKSRHIDSEDADSSCGVDMDRWASTLDSAMSDDAILVSDAGNFSQWILKHVSFGQTRIYLGPTNGAMGYGLPGALGASMAKPATRVWAVCGDGGLGMTLGELETVARLGRNIALVVVNNQSYGTIKSHQEARYGMGHAAASDLGPVDFAEVAKGMGWRGVSVDQDRDLADAFNECASNSGPYLIQVMSKSRPLTA
jgi:acetolactate synthase-1/2/3 large subunit